MRFKLQKGKSETRLLFFEIQASGNSETLVVSEMYKSKEAAMHATDLIKNQAGAATVVDAT